MAESVPATRAARCGSDERAQAQLAAIVEHSEDAIFAIDGEGRVTAWNRAAENLYGYTQDEMLGVQPNMIVPDGLREERDTYLRQILDGTPVIRYETRRMRRDGSEIEVAVTVSPIRDRAGAPVGASVIVRDVTEQRRDLRRRTELLAAEQRARIAAERSQRRLAEAQQRSRIAFEHAPNGIALISVTAGGMGRLLEVNPALGEKLGYGSDELLGRALADFAHPEDSFQPVAMLATLLRDEVEVADAETRFRRRDGDSVWLRTRASMVRDQDGRPLYAVAHFMDVTEARRYERELRFLADHDALTGLANRRHFEERLDALLELSRETLSPAAVLVVDLDNFKGVNDSYGHAVGDELLRRVAAALRSRVRSEDVVGRLGGDEFGVLLTDVSPDDARTVAGELLRAVDAETATPTDDGRVRVTASVGISTIDAGATLSAEEMLVEADVAMYEAKRTGRNRLSVAAGDDRGDTRQQWSRRVHEALQRDALELWEQPLLNLGTGECDRSEMLVRMRGRNGEAIPAAIFMPVVERFGQAQAIDRWVVSRAMAVLAERQAAGSRDGIAINLSAVSITDESVVDSILASVTSAAVDPTAITFEVTETAAVGDIGRARRLMERLAAIGCRFALDDFGAGFSSLHNLKHLPFDAVKIDGDFVGRLPEGRFDQLTIRAVVQIAKGSGKVTVAEHVSDDATLELLRGYGVDYAQGHHIAEPRPVQPPRRLSAAA